ncbi:MAG: imelysin family protein [Pseudomonadota bacterium]
MTYYKFIALFLIWFISFSSAQVFSADQTQLAQTAYEQHIIPAYNRLASETTKLKTQLTQFCVQPTQKALDKVHESYKSALLSWAGVEHIQFGPIVEDYKYERFAFWPDVNGRGLRQVQRVLAKKDQTVLSLDTLQKKSVALQGFTALEFLLHGTNYTNLIADDQTGQFRCKFAKTIGENLAVMAAEVQRGWQKNSYYSDAFLKPKINKIYARPEEVTQELFQSYVGGFDKIIDMKILRPIRKSEKQRANFKRAAYWRSGLSMAIIRMNLLALTDFFEIGGLSKFVSSQKPSVSQHVMRSLQNEAKELQRIDTSIQNIVYNLEQRSALRDITIRLKKARTQSAQAIIEAANLTIGFNAQDGD